MIKFHGSTFFAISKLLAEFSVSEVSDPDDFSNEGEVASWVDALNLLKDRCLECGLELSTIAVERLRDDIKRGDMKNWTQFSSRIPEIHQRIQDELDLHLFMQIPRDRVNYFQKTGLFGEGVSKAFPSASSDIEEAGNCYATDRNTASVFHSMRVLEHGLRGLAADLKVAFPGPIELENWQNIIEKIESEIRKINDQPKGLQKSQDLQFYSFTQRRQKSFGTSKTLGATTFHIRA